MESSGTVIQLWLKFIFGAQKTGNAARLNFCPDLSIPDLLGLEHTK